MKNQLLTLIIKAADAPSLNPDYSFGPFQAMWQLINSLGAIIFGVAMISLLGATAAILFKGFGNSWVRENAGKGFLIAMGGVILFGSLSSILTFGMHIPLGLN